MTKSQKDHISSLKSFNPFVAQLNNICIDYRSAPLHIRELYSFTSEQIKSLNKVIRETLGNNIILNTCNRFEVYISSELSPLEIQKTFVQILNEYMPTTFEDFNQYFRYGYGISCVQHLFQLASGLKSLVIGEGQILSQIKSQYKESLPQEPLLNYLFQKAISVGKKVRTFTKISQGAVSVPSACLQIIQKKYHIQDFSEMSVLVVGNGEIAKVCLSILSKTAADITLMERKPNPQIQYDAVKSIVSFPENLCEVIREYDLVMVCTSANEYLIKPNVQSSFPKQVIVCDMSMPRNVDPKVTKLANIELVDQDALQSAVDASLEQRQNEVYKAKILIQEEIEKLLEWCNNKLLVENDLVKFSE